MRPSFARLFSFFIIPFAILILVIYSVPAPHYAAAWDSPHTLKPPKIPDPSSLEPAPPGGATSLEDSHANVIVQRVDIQMADFGPARVVETTEPLGRFELEYRKAYANLTDKQTQEKLKQHMVGLYLATALDSWNHTNPADRSKPFTLVLESANAQCGNTELDSASAEVSFKDLIQMLPKELTEHDDLEDPRPNSSMQTNKGNGSFQFPAAFTKEWHYKITPPLGFLPGKAPGDANLTLGPALLTKRFTVDHDGVIHADIRFDSVKRKFTGDEAAKFGNGLAAVDWSESISFRPRGKVLWERGEIRESFRAYHDVVAQQPNGAVHHLRLAQALLDAGMGEAARNEARLAVKLAPDSALAEKTLADILEYDIVGRKFRPGSDYVGAAMAFRAAAQLDPEDKSIVTDLATLLEYNEDGLRYGPGAKLQQAVAVYRTLNEDELNRVGARTDLHVALFYSGDIDEACDRPAILDLGLINLDVACEAVQHGSEAAITEARKRARDDANLREILTAAGQILEWIRKYAMAADLLQAGVAGDNVAVQLQIAANISRGRLHEEVQFRNDPVDIARKYLLVNLDPDQTLDTLNEVLSKNAQIVLKNTQPEEIERKLKRGKLMRRKWARLGRVWDTNLDVAPQVADPKIEGNDSVGYRAKLQAPDFKKWSTVFVVKESGQYKVLDEGSTPDAIGLEVLDRVANHDLDGARVLLDWVRDEQHLSGGDDPLSRHAFPSLWARGRDADADQMRLAAAAILVQRKPTAQQGLAILEKNRALARSDLEKTNITAALLEGYGVLDDNEKVLALSAELVKQYPESTSAFWQQAWALRLAGRYSEAQALAEERLRRNPDDAQALKLLLWNAVGQEDFRSAYNYGQRLVDAGKAETDELNGMAWWSQFFPRPGGPDIDAALRASMAKQNDGDILSTLGCLYAETGKPQLAYEVTIHAMDVKELDEPDAGFWYVFGRIAEECGEREVAISDYIKVTKPKRAAENHGSSYQLAQIHLRILRGQPPQ
jgi:tetratricopeptide (TPR) repeat protein